MDSVDASGRCVQALTGARRVLMFGGYGCGNVGDEAILSVLADELADSFDITVVSGNPSSTTSMHGLKAVGTHPRVLLNALMNSDAVMIGGGGIFSAYMGTRSRALPLVAIAARALRKRVIVRALGVYGSTPRTVAIPLSRAIESADYVSVRDAASWETLASWGIRRSVPVEPDPAIRLKHGAYAGSIPTGSAGFALRRVRRPEVQRVLERQHLAEIDRLTGAGKEVLLLPFCHHPSSPLENDVLFAYDLRRRSCRPSLVHVLDDVKTPWEMMDVVSRLDHLTAMRFHAILFGWVSRTPMDIIAYDDKCASFAADLGLAYRSLEEPSNACPQAA